MADRAVDVRDSATGTADDVMMVVADAELEPGGMPCRFDAVHEPRVPEGTQDVVDGLSGDAPDQRTGGADDGVGVGVRMVPEHVQDGEPRCGHSQSVIPQLLGCRCRGHGLSQPHYLE